MNPNILFFPVLIGFLVEFINTRNYYKTAKMNGSRIVLYSAVSGYLYYAIVYWTVVKFLNWQFSWEIEFESTEMFYVCLSVYFIWVVIQESRIAIKGLRPDLIREAASERGDLLELLLIDALKSKKLITVTLKGGDVYTGLPFNNSENATDSSISVIPAGIGYVDKKTRRVKYKLNFIKTLSWITKPIFGSSKKLATEHQVVIAKSEILTVSMIDRDLFSAFAFGPKK